MVKETHPAVAAALEMVDGLEAAAGSDDDDDSEEKDEEEDEEDQFDMPSDEEEEEEDIINSGREPALVVAQEAPARPKQRGWALWADEEPPPPLVGDADLLVLQQRLEARSAAGRKLRTFCILGCDALSERALTSFVPTLSQLRRLESVQIGGNKPQKKRALAHRNDMQLFDQARAHTRRSCGGPPHPHPSVAGGDGAVRGAARERLQAARAQAWLQLDRRRRRRRDRTADRRDANDARRRPRVERRE